jgi:cytochrome P450
VFEESMRMYPPVPTVFKFTDRDMTILDYVIPKGTKLVVNNPLQITVIS